MCDNLTVVILTKNEETNIVDVVKNSFKVASNVLVVDSGSTDKTKELAENNGAKVVFRAWDNDFSAQRNFALEHVNTDWVLYLDADERLDEGLCKYIKEALSSDCDRQYSFIRKSIAFGKKFNYGVLRPDVVPRLFKTRNVKWINRVHEKPLCQDELTVAKGHIDHYTYNSWKQWLTKFNHYTSIWARDAYTNGKSVSLPSAFLHAIFGFLQMMVLKGGILDGWMGLVLCCLHFFYTLMKYLKLIELNNIYRAD